MHKPEFRRLLHVNFKSELHEVSDVYVYKSSYKIISLPSLLLTAVFTLFSHRERMQPEQTLWRSKCRKEEDVQPGTYMQCKFSVCHVYSWLFIQYSYKYLYSCSLLTGSLLY